MLLEGSSLTMEYCKYRANLNENRVFVELVS